MPPVTNSTARMAAAETSDGGTLAAASGSTMTVGDEDGVLKVTGNQLKALISNYARDVMRDELARVLAGLSKNH